MYKLRTIHLPPALQEMCDGQETVQYAAANFQHIVSALCHNYGQHIKQYIAENKWFVKFNDEESDYIYQEDIHNLSDTDHIYIEPAIEGAGRTGQIIIGIVMIVVGIISAFYGNPTALQMAQGGLMILSGASMIYTALNTPKAAQARADVDQRAGFVFNGAVNVVEQGCAVPVLYGRFEVGSVVASAGVYTEEIARYNSPPGSNTAPDSVFGVQDIVM